MKALLALLAALMIMGAGIPEEANALLEDGRIAEAVALVDDGVAAGDDEAINYKAWLLENGEYVDADLPRAVEFYRRAARMAHPHAQWRLGVLIDEGKADGSLEEAVALFEAAAEQDFPFAYVSLAVMYATGRGTEQDYGLSRHYYELGIAAGNIHAIRGVGVLYALGQGVTRDPVEAAAHFLLSYGLGNEESEAGLGELLGLLSEVEIRQVFVRANELAEEYGYDVRFDFDQMMSEASTEA